VAELPDWYNQEGSTATEEKVSPSSIPPSVNLPDWYGDNSQPLKASIDVGSKIPQDHAAKVLNLKDKTGLSTNFISRNVDAIQKQQQANTQVTSDLTKESPVVSDWLAEDPHHVALAGMDVPKLSFLERQFGYQKNQFERGLFDIERSALGAKAFFGLGSPEDEKRISSIDKRLGTDLNQKSPGAVSNIFGKVVEGLPMVAGTIGLGTAAAFGGAPAAAVTAGTAVTFGLQEAGNAYLDYRKRKDAEGNPLSDSEARGWATVSGVLNAALATVPMGKAFEEIPGLRMLGKGGIDSILASPTARTAFQTYIKGIGENAIALGGYSGFGTLIHSAAGTLAEMQNDKSIHTASPIQIISKVFSPQALKEAAESAGVGALTGVAVGGTMGSFRFYNDSRNAIQTQEVWKNIGETVKATKMNELAPEQLEKVISRIAPDQNVFIPIEKWQTYWESQKVDPRTAFKETVGDTSNYDESIRAGTDLQIPASKFATTIAPSEHLKAFLPSLRSSPDVLNVDEVEQGKQFQQEQEKAVEGSKKASLMEKGIGFVKNLFGRGKSPTSPDVSLQAQQELPSSSQTKEMSHGESQSTVFPVEPGSFTESIAEHPDFQKITQDAEAVVRKYAQERGVEPTREFATNLFREMHDALGEIMQAPMEKRLDKIKEIKERYPDIEKEFNVVKDKLFVDKTEGYFEKWVARQYGGSRPKIAIETEQAKAKEGIPSKEETNIKFTKDQADKSLLAARMEQGTAPLFDNPKAVGMTPEQEARYLKARLAAEESASKQMADKIRQEQDRIQNADRKSLREEIEPIVNAQKEYRAIDTLKGTTGLDRSAIEKDFPTFDFKRLPKGTVANEGGNHPDLAAEMLGYRSGSELLFNLETSSDREQVIKDKIEERIREKYGDPMEQVRLRDESFKAIHNEDRGRLLQLELQHLASENFAAFKGMVRALTRQVPRLEEVKNQAQEIIGRKKAGDTLPYLYQRAESLAGREAKEYFLSGDIEKAFEAKSRELLNHELFRSAQHAKEQTEKDISFASKFDKDSIRKKLGKAGADYLEQIDAIREKFDFSPISGKETGRRQSLRDFVDEQRKAGYEPAIPPEILNEAYRKSYREMSNDELHGIVDTMRNLDHLAGLKNKLLKAQAGRDFDEVKTEITTSLKNNFDIKPEDLNKPIDRHPSMVEKMGNAGSDYAAWLTKMEFLFRFMDKGEYHGKNWETFFKPMNEAEDFKTSEMRKAYDSINDIFKDYSKSERANFQYKLTYVPELEGSKMHPNMNKAEMMMTLLHWGNEGNRTELMRGWNLREDQLQAIWKHLDAKDFQAVNRIWNFINSYWPQVSEQERRLNGLTPEKIQASPFDVKLQDGSTVHMEGGYFPLVYDKNVSWNANVISEAENLKDLFPTQAGRAATKHGWTNERVGGGGMAPSLNMATFINHVGDVIHDLAYREPVIDLYKLINDEDIKSHIETSVGKDLYKQLNPWLKRIAGDRPWNPLGPIGNMLNGLRSNMTMAELGFKFTSAAIHTTSFLPAVRELGLKYAFSGMKDSANILKAWDFVSEKSEFMKSRPDNFDRDIRAAGRDLNIAGAADSFLSKMMAYSPIQRSSFWAIMRGFDLGVAIPTWMGAYRKAMEGGVKNIESGNEPEAIEYADQLVRDTKGSGAAKDLAPIQTAGGELGKLFTMFYTQLNVIGNQIMEAHREFNLDRNLPKLATAYAMNVFLPAAMTELIRGRTPKTDEGIGKWLTKAIALYPMETMPGLREAVSYWQRGDLQASPVFEAVKSMLKTSKDVAQVTPGLKNLVGEKEEWSDKDYQDALMSIGYATGLPTRQAIRTSQYLYDLMTGEEQPSTPMEGMYRTLVGRKAKE
jgi:hypothetical protein